MVQTVPGVWKSDDNNSSGMTIDNDRLLAWPESGDLLDLDECIKVNEVDKDGNIVQIDNEPNSDNNIPEDDLLKDGNDIGPAPLQNPLAPLETFEAVNDIDNKNTANIANAKLAVEELNNHMNFLASDEDTISNAVVTSHSNYKNRVICS